MKTIDIFKGLIFINYTPLCKGMRVNEPKTKYDSTDVGRHNKKHINEVYRVLCEFISGLANIRKVTNNRRYWTDGNNIEGDHNIEHIDNIFHSEHTCNDNNTTKGGK